jgi:hypothetical protein
MIDIPPERRPPSEQSTSGHRPVDLAREWQELCEWFKTKASEAVSRTDNPKIKESVLLTVAAFCRDEPPKTFEGFKAFKRFAEAHVRLWETVSLPDSGGTPKMPRNGLGHPSAQ